MKILIENVGKAETNSNNRNIKFEQPEILHI